MFDTAVAGRNAFLFWSVFHFTFDRQHERRVNGVVGSQGDLLLEWANALGVVFHFDGAAAAWEHRFFGPFRNRAAARALGSGDDEGFGAYVGEFELAVRVGAFFNGAIIDGRDFEFHFGAFDSLLSGNSESAENNERDD